MKYLFFVFTDQYQFHVQPFDAQAADPARASPGSCAGRIPYKTTDRPAKCQGPEALG
jgi:hypothetical protein